MISFLGDKLQRPSGSQELRLVDNLRVRLLEARDLSIRGAASSDRRIFCSVRLDRDEIYHSSAVPKTINPFFGDDFTKEIQHRNFSELHFYLYDSGRVPRPFARLSFKKSEVVKLSGQDAWFPLKPCDRHAEVSRLGGCVEESLAASKCPFTGSPTQQIWVAAALIEPLLKGIISEQVTESPTGKMQLEIGYEECLLDGATGGGVSQSIRLRVLDYSDLNLPSGVGKNVDLYLMVTLQSAGKRTESKKLRIPYRRHDQNSPSGASKGGGNLSLSTSPHSSPLNAPSTSASAPSLIRRRTSPSPTFDEPPTLRMDLSALSRRSAHAANDNSPPASPTTAEVNNWLTAFSADANGNGGGNGDDRTSGSGGSGDAQSPPPPQLKVSLWHDVLAKFQSYFHGELRIALHPKTLRPKNGAHQPHVAWYYLKPRTSSSSSSSVTPTSPSSPSSEPGGGLGSLRLRMCYTQEHVLPLAHYAELQRNLVDSVLLPVDQPPTAFQFTPAGLTELLPRVDLETVARPLMKIFLHENRIRSLIRALAAQEIYRCEDVNTLFRSSSLASKVVYELMKFVGQQYLLTTLKTCVDKIYAEKRCCEVDPSKLLPGQSLEENTRNLISYAETAFLRVTDSNHKCPTILKEVFADLRDITALHYPGRIEVQRLVLGSFLVMRFFSAAIVNPKLFNLKRDNAEPMVARTLALISKILQKLSNYVVCGQGMTSKEKWLSPILEQFLNETHKLAVVRYLDRISCLSTENSGSGDSITILKEGYLNQRFPRQRRCFELSWMQTRRRYVVLNETELIWYKRKGDSSSVGRLSLCDLKVAQDADESKFSSSLIGGVGGGAVSSSGGGGGVSSFSSSSSSSGAGGQKHVMEFATVEGGGCASSAGAAGSSIVQLATGTTAATSSTVYLQASDAMEMHEWLLALHKQCRRQRMAARALTSACAANAAQLYEVETEKELEAIHMVFVEHIETINRWKFDLDGTLALSADYPPLPASLHDDEDAPAAGGVIIAGGETPSSPPSHAAFGSFASTSAFACTTLPASELTAEHIQRASSGMTRQQKRDALLLTLNKVLGGTYTLERSHRDAVTRLFKQTKYGSKDMPIGDDNYLLLKSRMNKELTSILTTPPPAAPPPPPNNASNPMPVGVSGGVVDASNPSFFLDSPVLETPATTPPELPPRRASRHSATSSNGSSS